MSPTLSLVDLKLLCRVGVPEQERAKPQKLLCTVVFPVPNLKKAATTDHLSNTIDYHALSQLLQSTALRGQRKLIEKLASELAQAAFRRFRLPWIEIELKKFILPETRHISLRARFTRSGIAHRLSSSSSS
jgi:dihydroneopterin aldolase